MPDRQQSYTALEQWLLSPRGKKLLNRFYSWGAACVILGALFMFLEWRGAEWVFALGMITEVLVFVVSGFEPVQHKSAPEPASSRESVEWGEAGKTANSLGQAELSEYRQLRQSVESLRREQEELAENLRQLNIAYRRMLEAMNTPPPTNLPPDAGRHRSEREPSDEAV